MTAAPPDLDAFVAREHPRLLGTISLYLGDAAVAEEVVQEALVAVASRWSRVRGMAAPGAYAHRTAMNIATSTLRRRGAERGARARAGDDPHVHHDPDTPDRLAVRAAVRALPAPQREAVVLRYFLELSVDEEVAQDHGLTLVLRYFLELSVDEAAERMGRTNQAVRNLTHRAVRRLRDELSLDLEVEEATDVH